MALENEIVEKWISDRKSIIFWGASQRAKGIIKGLNETFPDISPKTVIDKGLAGSTIDVGGVEHSINAPDEISITNEDRIILFLSRRKTYEAVKRELELKGYKYGTNFIDASNIRDRNGGLLTKYRYSDINITELYSPWLEEQDFLDVMDDIKENTLVDVLRCYELWRLVCQSAKCLSGDILEVGVWRGGTGALISAAARRSDINCDIYLADTFEGVVKVTDTDLSYEGGEHSDTSEEIVTDLIGRMSLNRTKILRGIFPDDFGKDCDGNTYRFVHIDVDIYQSAKDVFSYVWHRMEHGGCVVFDDYGNMYTSGVTELCEELASQVNDGIFLYNMNKHGVFVKL